MNRLSISEQPKFRLIAVLTLAAVVSIGAWSAPKANAYLAHEANKLMAEADKMSDSDSRQAGVNYQMAALMQPFNQATITRLADFYTRVGQPDDAIATLQRLPIGESGLRIADLQFRSGQYEESINTLNKLIEEKVSAQALLAKSRAELELGQADKAIQDAKDASSYALQDIDTQLHLGLAYAVGEKGSDFDALVARLKPPEALKTLRAIQASKSALAQALYVTGLPRSARRVLAKQSTLTMDNLLLLARIDTGILDYQAAKDALLKATALDPANLTARKMLLSIYEKLGDHEAADKESGLINQLETGQI